MNHAIFEKNSLILLIATLIVVSIGGIIEIAPLFMLQSTIEKVEGMRPYSPLELAGRDIYVREGCYNCHSQMIRSLRDEIERYGHYSLAAESMYDHPFQWGSKRTGPDLARVGAKYNNLWHLRHLDDPRVTSPGSIMPSYAFLLDSKLDLSLTQQKLKVMVKLGVPYSEAQVNAGVTLAKAQAKSIADDLAKEGVTGMEDKEVVALIAYLQRLGTDIRGLTKSVEIAPAASAVSTTTPDEALARKGGSQ